MEKAWDQAFLIADIEEKVYKALFLDVGLMNAICGLNWRVVSQMDAVKLINEGAIADFLS